MASPLILKPLALAPHRAVAMVARLRTVPLDNIRITLTGQDLTEREFGSDKIRPPDPAAYKDSPMAGRTERGSALEAFITFAREGGFA